GVAGIVTPGTILRWIRELGNQKYDGTSQRGGRRPVAESVTNALLRIARASPTFGYTRLRDALDNLGHEVARSTVRRILEGHGIKPAPERGRESSWKTFFAAHWDQ